MTTAPPSEPQKIPVNRTLVGIISLVCLCSAGGLAIRYHGDDTWWLWIGGFSRAGLLMGAVWIALPTRSRDAAWASVTLPTLFGFIVALVAVARYRWLVIPMMAAVFVIGAMNRISGRRNREPRGGNRPDRSSWK